MATIKLNTTNGELVDLMNGLYGVQDVQGKDFARVVAKNLSTLHASLKELETIGKPSEAFVKFATEMKRLQDSSDSKGCQLLEEKNADLVAERKKQLDVVQDELKKDGPEIELDMITSELIPDSITARHLTNLQKIIA